MEERHVATVKINKVEKRWELWIDGEFKAYTTGSGSDKDLIKLAEEKGYKVIIEDE